MYFLKRISWRRNQLFVLLQVFIFSLWMLAMNEKNYVCTNKVPPDRPRRAKQSSGFLCAVHRTSSG